MFHQAEVAECGAACIGMVLASHGAWVPMPELRVACNVSRDGSSALDLVKAARGFGLKAQGHKIQEIEGLRELVLPAVLHWDLSHYVVLERIGPRGAVVVDPRSGRVSISLKHISQHFTGIALSFQQGADFRKRTKARASWSHYVAMIRPYGATLFQLLCASAVMQLVALAMPASTRVLVDHVLVTAQTPWLWALGVGLAMVAVSTLCMTLMRAWVLQVLQIRLDRALVSGALAHLLALPMSYFLQREAGELVQRVQANTMIRAMLSEQSLMAILDASLVFSYLLLMLAFDPLLGGLMAALGVAQFTLVALVRQSVKAMMIRELSALGNEESAVVATLSSLETTRAIGMEDHLLSRWQGAANAAANRRMDRGKVEIILRQSLGLIKGLAVALVLWVGGEAVLDGRMLLGEFAAFITLSSLFLAPVEALANAVTELQMLGAQLHRMDDVLGVAPEVHGEHAPRRLAGSVSVERLSHRYAEGAPWSLRNVSLKIEAGERVAIVGQSGSGKSTLARLVSGLHMPTDGSVRVDDVCLTEYDLPALRRMVGTVLQEPFLFDTTIQQNLILLKPSATLDEIRRAAKLACIDEFIETLPDGYETRVGENGGKLSGGQKQRICLARALVASPSLLILDEATSALDRECELEVHANLRSLNVTQIIIVHRLEAIRNVDRIMVMHHGVLVEQGDYESLLAADGEFSMLVRAGHEVLNA